MTQENSAAAIPEIESLAERAAGPARFPLPDGRTVWVVGDNAHVRTVLSDPRFSADDQQPGYPRLLPLPLEPGGLSFLRMDPPRHDVLRRVLTPVFTMRRIEALRGPVTRLARELLGTLRAAGPPADLVAGFALPLPSQVICLLLGVPYADRAMFQHHSGVILSFDATGEEAGESMAALGAYLGELAAAKRAHPGEDLLSQAVRRQEATGMSDADVTAMARLMLVAGHETTANMIGLAVLTLFREPERQAALRADPELIKPAVEELLRFLSVVRAGIGRVALEDVPLTDEVTVRAGEGVVFSLRSANHDPAAFADPGTLDFGRDARGHLAFGYGVHQCLGQALARLELQIALRELLAEFPDLRSARPPEEIRVRDRTLVAGVESLPVVW
ncbi:cytochrome P450 [Streptomyces sp. JJ36]|uniref:cytochrome P450 n=1 Tax=Streptomyces sp. JJ36 TaxID=2736645 RepID=UPI001F2F2F40|nr:cytochrome P450 [Streptomyces sp. JJ36]MCF6523531.1 cytochrome P450 [Streptomyces sp. JJ36]